MDWNNTESPLLTETAEHLWALKKYLPIVLVIIGTIGNSLTIITVSSKYCKKSSFTVYIAALALFDTIILNVWTLDGWLKSALDIAVDHTSAFVCRSRLAAACFAGQASAWLIAALTIERTFCTYFPHRTRSVCRPQFGIKIVVAIVLVSLASNAHLVYGHVYANVGNSTTQKCGFISQDYASIATVYVTLIFFLCYFLIPAVIIIVCNTATVIRVSRSSHGLSSTANQLHLRRTMHILRMTIVVTTAFILLIGPFNVFVVIRPFVFGNVVFPGAKLSQKHFIVETIVLTLAHFYHASNFFLYILSGSRFRQDLRSAFCRPVQTRARQNHAQNEPIQRKPINVIADHLQQTTDDGTENCTVKATALHNDTEHLQQTIDHDTEKCIVMATSLYDENCASTANN